MQEEALNDFRSEIEQIKSRAGIVDIVSEYIALRKSGRNFIGLCPFHKEKTPSFSVNAEKQIFYCFGCGIGGDVFEFLIKMNNMSFSEALNHLAEKTGIVLRDRHAGTKGEEKTLREKIKDINRMAGERFKKNLMSGAGKSAREYLQKRGINDTTVREYNLGLALNGWRNLRSWLENEKIPLPLAEKAGLIIRGEKGEFYDRFRSRLIFPIENIAGEVIAFGGRASGDEKPKYLNSPESPVYIKGRHLYGLSRAKDEIRKKKCALLVEGYFDVLSLWNAGIRNAVAALGTALTREHLDLLRRFTDHVVAIFDPDEGGRTALERSLTLFLEEKFSASVVILPENLDPDEYIKKYGPEAMQKLIAGSQSLVDYYIENVIGSRPGFEEDLDTVQKAVPFIGRIEDPVQKNLFIKRVSEKLKIDQELLKSEIVKVSSGHRRKSEVVKKIESKQKSKLPDPVEMTMIRLMIEFPDKIKKSFDEEIFEYFLNPELKTLGKLLKTTIQSQDEFRFYDLLNCIEDTFLKNKLLQWTVSESPFESGAVDILIADTMEKIRLRWIRMRKEYLDRELKSAQEKGDSVLCDRILLETTQLLRKKELAIKS